ncbi:hypothetical protein KR054_011552 [Drosophila jambulina]|nr:hypothetical protein KR054_011552 [Drosophila jambulina]
MMVNLLTALPASELEVQSSEEAWSVEKACNEVQTTSMFGNQDDPTCSSYVYCYVSNGQVKGLIKSCKKGQYFDDRIKMCVSTKPDVCA